MEMSIENAGPCTNVRLYGRLDSKGAGAIYDTIAELWSLGPGMVVVSVGSVTQATRAGCRALTVAAKLLHARTGEKLLINDATAEIASILEVAGFGHLIHVGKSSDGGLGVAA